MKSNFLSFYALHDLKTHKKDTWITIITLIIACLIIIIVSYLSPLFSLKNFTNQTYQYSLLEESGKDIKDVHFVVNGVEMQYGDERIHSAIRHDIIGVPNIKYVEGDYEILGISVQAGHMPKARDELLVSKHFLKAWGYDEKINQQIQILWYENGQNILKDFQVVGITENPYEYGYVGYSDQIEQSELFLDVQNATVTSQEASVIYNGLFVTDAEKAYILTFVYFITFLLAFSILTGVTLSSFEDKKHDFALLRGIGATHRQLLFIILFQACILTIISIMISHFIFFLLKSIIFPTSIYCHYTLSAFLICLFFVLCLVFFSFFLPLRSSSRNILASTFDGSQFQYFYYRYHKRHYMRPFYLAWRQLVSKKELWIKCLMIFVIGYNVMVLVNNQRQEDTYLDDTVLLDDYIDMRFYGNHFPKDSISLLQKQAQILVYYYTFDEEIDMSVDAEIYVYLPNQNVYQYIEELNERQVAISEQVADNYQLCLSDMIKIQGQDYEIVEIVNERYPFMSEIFVVLSQDHYDMFSYDEQAIYAQFDTLESKKKGTFDFVLSFEEPIRYVDATEESVIDYSPSPSYSQSIFVLFFCCMYFYHASYEMYKEKETISTYQLIGFTKREILSIYIFKALYLIIVGYSLALFFFGNTYDILQWESIIYSLSLIVLLNVISIFPFYFHFKNTGLENRV